MPEHPVPTHNLVIIQHAPLPIAFPITNTGSGDPQELADWTAKAQVRGSATSEIVLHEWSTTDGTIVLADGTATLQPPEDTDTWTWGVGRYDLVLTNPSGTPYRVAEGVVVVDTGITHL